MDGTKPVRAAMRAVRRSSDIGTAYRTPNACASAHIFTAIDFQPRFRHGLHLLYSCKSHERARMYRGFAGVRRRDPVAHPAATPERTVEREPDLPALARFAIQRLQAPAGDARSWSARN